MDPREKKRWAEPTFHEPGESTGSGLGTQAPALRGTPRKRYFCRAFALELEEPERRFLISAASEASDVMLTISWGIADPAGP